jgi:hypothetical protein
MALFRRGLVQLGESGPGQLMRKLKHSLWSLNIQPLHLAIILIPTSFVVQALPGIDSRQSAWHGYNKARCH